MSKFGEELIASAQEAVALAKAYCTGHSEGYAEGFAAARGMAAETCAEFARIALSQDGISGDAPEHDAAASCAHLIRAMEPPA